MRDAIAVYSVLHLKHEQPGIGTTNQYNLVCFRDLLAILGERIRAAEQHLVQHFLPFTGFPFDQLIHTLNIISNVFFGLTCTMQWCPI